MKILKELIGRNPNVLPLQCACGLTVLYRVINPEIDAHCPGCGAEKEVERLINDLLISEGQADLLIEDSGLKYEQYEIQSD